MRSHLRCSALSFLALAAAGCTPEPPGPTKELQVPAGGAPVLTSAERAALDSQAYATSAVARVAFAEDLQPVPEPKELKPLAMWTEQEAAADALGRIGSAAVPDLILALENHDPAVRLKATHVLGRMGPDAAAAVPSLIRLLNDADPDVRKAATRTLGQIGPAAKDAVPSLMKSLLQSAP